jgi:hypothetical protein
MDLWNNPMVNNALKALTPEQLKEYQQVGEYMYGSVNFEDNKFIKNIDPPLTECVAYIEEGIKAGLMPSDLTEDEVVVLTKAYGDKWYEIYGFDKSQVPEEGLSIKMKDEIEAFVQKKIDDSKKTSQKSKDVRKRRKEDKKHFSAT